MIRDYNRFAMFHNKLTTIITYSMINAFVYICINWLKEQINNCNCLTGTNIIAEFINARTIQDEIIIIFQVIDYQDDYF
jgi:hypothetical protein